MRDSAVFIALTTGNTSNPKDFYEKEFENGIYKTHREKLHLTPDKNSLNLYTPTPFFMLGRWDLAMICQIDSPTLPTRVFKPFQPIHDEYYPREGFDYKVLTGFRTECCNFSNKLDFDKEIISITTLKVSDFLSLGLGQYLIDEVVRVVLEDLKSFGDDLSYSLLRSNNYSEFTLILNSDSIETIFDTIGLIRDMTINDLGDEKDKDYKSEDYCPKIAENTLLYQVFEKIDRFGSIDDKGKIKNNHLFISSDTVLGLKWNLVIPKTNQDGEHEYEDLSSIKKSCKLNYDLNFTIQPGHVDETNRLLRKIIDSNKTKKSRNISIGRRDMLWRFEEKSITDIIELYRAILQYKEDQDGNITFPNLYQLNLYVDEFELKVFYEDESQQNLAGEPFKYFHLLSKLQIDQKYITEIKSWLEDLGLPINLKDRVLTILSNYNNVVTNPESFIYYIDFYFYLKKVFHSYIREQHNNSKDKENNKIFILEQVRENIQKKVQINSRAFSNRFFQSLKTGEIGEFNTAFRGALQQYLLIYNSAFNSLCSLLGDGVYEPRSICHITGSSGIRSTHYTLELNPNHFTNPLTFCNALFHESANFFYIKLYRFVLSSEGRKKFGYKQIKSFDANEIPSNERFFKNYYSKEDSSFGFPDYHFISLSYLSNSVFKYDNKSKRITDTSDEILKTLNTHLGHISEKTRIAFRKRLFDRLLIEYFEKDVLTFCLGFNFNLKRFVKSFWSYFLLTTYNYSKKNIIHPGLLIQMLVRYYFVIKFNKEVIDAELRDASDDYQSEEKRFFKAMEQRNDNFSYYRKAASDIAEYVIKVDEIDKANKYHYANIKHVLQYGLSKDSRVQANTIKDKIEHITNEFQVIFTSLDGSWLEVLDNVVLSEKNSVFRPEYIHFLRFNTLINCYIDTFDVDDLILVPENDKERIDKIFYDNTGRIRSFDSKRAELNQRRKVFFDCMWHFSSCFNKEVLSGILFNI